MARRTSPNKYVAIKDWLGGTWGGVATALIGICTFFFSLGAGIGNYVTKNEYNYKIIELKFDHQKELAEEKEKEKEKGRDQALREMKEQQEQAEKIYSIMTEAKK